MGRPNYQFKKRQKELAKKKKREEKRLRKLKRKMAGNEEVEAENVSADSEEVEPAVDPKA